jgi:spore coat polysaccharide biosynthesis protein SpsF
MRVGAIVLARLGSSRLPAKVLHDAGGRPLLQYVLDRIARVDGLDAVVVATSADAQDDRLAEWCAANGVAVYRGALDDVRGRVIACAAEHGLDAVARVNADSPWTDPDLLERAVAAIRTGEHDLVTNVQERSYPYGVSAEVVTVAALRRAAELSDDPQDAEHVTRTIYWNPEAFSVANLRSERPYDTSTRLTVDTPEDLDLFERLIDRLGRDASSAGTPQLLATVAELKATPRT